MKMSWFLILFCQALGYCLALQATLSEWNADNYPNPLVDPVSCGRYDTSFICDPNSLLKAEEADTLEWILKSISTFSKCPCSSHTCKSKSFGYVVGIALMSKLEIPNGGNANDNEKLAALRNFTFNLEHQKWKLGDCNEDIIIAYDADIQSVCTFTGDTAGKKLSQTMIDAITSEKKHYFQGNKHVYTGLRSMILDYKEVLTDGGFSLALLDDQIPKNAGSQVLGAVTSIVMLLAVHSS